MPLQVVLVREHRLYSMELSRDLPRQVLPMGASLVNPQVFSLPSACASQPVQLAVGCGSVFIIIQFRVFSRCDVFGD